MTKKKAKTSEPTTLVQDCTFTAGSNDAAITAIAEALKATAEGARELARAVHGPNAMIMINPEPETL